MLKASYRRSFNRRERARDDGILRYLIYLSIKHDIDPYELLDSCFEAEKKDIVMCGPLRIELRERTEDYVLIKTEEEELDYSKGDKNVYTIYEGEGGVLIGSVIRKLLFAIEFMDPQIFFTTSLKPESRIMYNRRIRNRANILAPFLQYDGDPYMVVSQGKLFWILDAYTTSEMYPYSSRIQMPGTKKYINYIRNSVKVIVDAYNGKINFYALDDMDPILRTYERIFPDLFKPFESMPDDLKKHVRYPKDLFLHAY